MLVACHSEKKSIIHAFGVICTLIVITLIPPSAHSADDLILSVHQIEKLRGRNVGDIVDKLVWRGGLVLSSELEKFGGLSGLSFVDGANHFVAVSDRGQFISAELIYSDQGAPSRIKEAQITPINNSSGKPLPRRFAQDAEAISPLFPRLDTDGVATSIRIGFENLTRVSDFVLKDGRPVGAAKMVNIPQSWQRNRSNESIEALCVAPAASPIAGSTLLIAEHSLTSNNAHSGWLLGNKDRGPLEISRTEGLDPTACAFLSNGDLIILERGTSMLGFKLRLRHIQAQDVQPGLTLTGETLLRLAGPPVDNMEGLAVHKGPAGDTRLTLVSDDNFSSLQRTVILQFSLPE